MDFPEILTTRVLTATAENFKFPTFVLQNMVPVDPIDGDLAEWDITEPNVKVDTDFVVRDGEAQPTDYNVIKHQTANLFHTFKWKKIDPEHLENLRGVGTRERRSREHITREQVDMVRRHGALLDEYLLWRMLSGSITVTIGGVSTTVDYGLPNSHKPTAAVSWFTAGTDILSDIRDWKNTLTEDSSRIPQMAFFNSSLTPAFINNTVIQNYLSNSAEGARVVSEGMVSRLMGLRLIEWDGVYKTSAGTTTKFVPDDRFIILPELTIDWIKMIRGTVAIPADDGQSYSMARDGFYVDVSKNPVALLMYYKACRLPVMTVPKCEMYCDVTP